MDNITNNHISVIKLLMAENLKMVIDKYIMESNSLDLPERYFELFDLANHVSNKIKDQLSEKTPSDISNLVKKD